MLLGILPARGDDGWTLTTADFRRQSANLKALDDAGATLHVYGQPAPATIPLDQLLQLDRGNATLQVRGAYALHLTSGDRIGGEPAAIADDQLTWKSPAAGDLVIPLKDVRGIARGGDTPIFEDNPVEDTVLLANGDNVKGIITGLDQGKLAVKQTTGDVLPVDLAAAKAVLFAAARTPAAPGRAFRVQLADGSVITAPKVKLADDKLTLSFGPGNDRLIPLAQVTLIEQLNGPVSWLSARTPAETIALPMFDAAFPPQMDRNYRGDRIKFQGRDYARGIGVHAYTKLTWSLEPGEEGGYKAFRTQYALNEDAYKGRVTVRILLDDKLVHEEKDVTAGKLSPVILLDLNDAKSITLEAHPGGDTSTDDRTKWNIDTQARLNWIEPALLKSKPAPPPPPPAPATAPTTKPAQPTPAPTPAPAPTPEPAAAPDADK